MTRACVQPAAWGKEAADGKLAQQGLTQHGYLHVFLVIYTCRDEWGGKEGERGKQAWTRQEEERNEINTLYVKAERLRKVP